MFLLIIRRHASDRVPIEVLAIDDLGATSRAGTHAFFIDVRAHEASGMSARSGRMRTEGFAVIGKTFYVAVDGGIWSDPNTWLDTHGAHGVPGANDTAYVDDNKSVTFPGLRRSSSSPGRSAWRQTDWTRHLECP